MKNLLVALFLLFSLSSFSQNIKERTVLEKFVLGVDSIESVQNKVDISEYNIYECVEPNGIKTSKITYFSNLESFTLLLVNDTLYGVKYYPFYVNINDEIDNIKKDWLKGNLTDVKRDKLISKIDRYDRKTEKLVLNYKKYLNTKYNAFDTLKHWFNEYVDIVYDYDGNEMEYFVHYDIVLLQKYPQYKDF